MSLTKVESRQNFDVYSIFCGITILKHESTIAYNEIIEILDAFSVKREHLKLGKGEFKKSGFGDKTPMTIDLEVAFVKKKWSEKKFQIDLSINEKSHNKKTHEIDLYKEGGDVAIEIEWNNKDTFYHRDLNNLALLHQFECIKCGIIITKASDWDQYGGTSTHFDKLLEFVNAGASRTCPLVIFAIKSSVVGQTEKTLTPEYIEKIKKDYGAKRDLIKISKKTKS